MVFIEERQPIDSVLLVFPQVRTNCDWDLKGIYRATIQHLRDEFALLISLRKQLLGHSRWIRNPCLPSDSVLKQYITSRGTSFTRVANVSVASNRISLSLSLIRPMTGTIKNITYGRISTSSVFTKSKC